MAMINTAIVDIGRKTRVVVGMNWEILEPGVEKKPARYARDSTAAHYCLIKGSADRHEIGLSRESRGALNGKGAAAGMLAQLRQNFIAVLTLKDAETRQDIYWMVVVDQDGFVRPGTDIVSDNLQDIHQEIEIQQDALEGFAFYTTGNLADEFGEYQPSIVEANAVFEGTDEKAVRIRDVKDSKKTVAALLALLVLAGVGYWVVQAMLTPEPVKLVDKGLTEEEIQQIQRESYLKRTTQALTMALPTTQDRDWILRARDMTFQMPIESEGYGMTSVSCTYSGTCNYTFEKKGNTYIVAFTERYKQVADGDILFPFDGKGASFKRSLPAIDLAKPHDLDFIRQAPRARSFYKELLVRFQTLRNNGITGWSRSSTQPDPLSATPPPSFMNVPRLYQGSIDIRIDQLWLLETFLKLLDNPYVSITKFDVNVDESPSITLEANYVVAK